MADAAARAPASDAANRAAARKVLPLDLRMTIKLDEMIAAAIVFIGAFIRLF